MLSIYELHLSACHWNTWRKPDRCWVTVANDWTVTVQGRCLANGQYRQFCGDPQKALPAALMVHCKLWSDNRLWSVEGQEQLNLSLQPCSAVCCDVKSLCVYGCVCVCACLHLAVNQRETLALVHFFLHSSNVAGWHTDNGLSLCLLLACRAARSGLAVPDTEEAQGRRPAPWSSTDDWAGGLCAVMKM